MNIYDIHTRLEAEINDSDTHTVDDVMGVIDEAVDKAIDEHSDVQSVIDDAQDLADEGEVTEMMFAHIDHMMQVIGDRGCSRDIIAAFDMNGSLTKMIESRLGAAIYVENLDTVGNPYDTTTIATLEGLGEMAKKAWEWIKKVFKKIIAFMSRMFAAVMVRFGNAEKTIGRLRKEYAARSDSTNPDSNKEVYDHGKLKAVYASLVDASKFFFERNKKYSAEVDALVRKAKAGNDWDEADYSNEASKKINEEAKKKIDDIKSKLDSAKSGKVKAKDIPWGSIGTNLADAIKYNEAIMSLKQTIDLNRMSAKHAEQAATRLANIGYKPEDNKSMGYDENKMEYRGASKAKSQLKEFRSMAGTGNQIARDLTKLVGYFMTTQRMMLSALNTRIMMGKKS